MPLEQKLPEDITAEGREYAFKGIAGGLEYAQKSRALKLQAEELDQKERALKEKKDQNTVDKALKFLEMAKRARELPAPVAKAMINSYSEQFESIGMPIDDVAKAVVMDKDLGLKFADMHDSLREGLQSGNLAEIAPQLQEFNSAVGQKDGIDTFMKIVDNFSREKQAAIQAKTRLEQFQEGQKGIQSRFKENIDERRITKIQNDVQEIDKRYMSQLGAVDLITSMAPEELMAQGKEKNSQVQLAMARLSLALSEFRNSVAMEGEVRQIKGGQSWFNKAKLALGNAIDGEVYSEKVIADIQKLAEITGKVTLKTKQQELMPLYRQAKKYGFGDRTEEIFNPRNMKLIEAFNRPKAKIAPQGTSGKTISAPPSEGTSLPVSPKMKSIFDAYEKKHGKPLTIDQMNKFIRMQGTK